MTTSYVRYPSINSSGSIVPGSIALTNTHVLVGNASNVAADVAMTGDVTITNAGVTAIGTNKVANAQLAQMAANTIKGNNTAGLANAVDLTVAQTNTLLGTVTTLAAVGASPNANGASISSNTLTLQPADATNPGVLSNTTQTILGAKTFSTQLIGAGTATNDAAAAGFIGQIITAGQSTPQNFGGASGVWADLTSVSLTAGDWDVSGSITWTLNGATLVGYAAGAISINSGNTTTDQVIPQNVSQGLIPATGVDRAVVLIPYRLSLSATTTVYLKGWIQTVTLGTPQAYSFLRARRVR